MENKAYDIIFWLKSKGRIGNLTQGCSIELSIRVEVETLLERDIFARKKNIGGESLLIDLASIGSPF